MPRRLQLFMNTRREKLKVSNNWFRGETVFGGKDSESEPNWYLKTNIWGKTCFKAIKSEIVKTVVWGETFFEAEDSESERKPYLRRNIFRSRRFWKRAKTIFAEKSSTHKLFHFLSLFILFSPVPFPFLFLSSFLILSSFSFFFSFDSDDPTWSDYECEETLKQWLE